MAGKSGAAAGAGAGAGSGADKKDAAASGADAKALVAAVKGASGKPLWDRSLPPIALSKLLAVEAACAVVAAGAVAPFIAIVDKSIIANASGRQPLVAGLTDGLKTLFTKPLYFFRQPAFLLIWGVYGGTYIAANSAETLCDHTARPWQIPKFLASSSANVSLSVAKDKVFTRMFGVGEARPLPRLSYACFTTRDSMTIMASFNLPYILSGALQTQWKWDKARADVAAQLSTPCAVQLLSTPLHLYGLDLYNRTPIPANGLSRAQFIQREYVKTALARMARIFPAFGIGGVTNKYLRATAREQLGTTHFHPSFVPK